MRRKLGLMGCSSLAAISNEMVDNRHTWSRGNVQWPMLARYLSKMLTAMNSVSILYSFLTCKSNIFYTA